MKSLTSKELLPSFIDINGTRIESESQIKLLGITIDDKLKFNKHIDILCKNAARQINVLYRFSGIFDLKAIHLFWQILIITHLYGIFIYKENRKGSRKSLKILHNDKTSSYALLLEKNTFP